MANEKIHLLLYDKLKADEERRRRNTSGREPGDVIVPMEEEALSAPGTLFDDGLAPLFDDSLAPVFDDSLAPLSDLYPLVDDDVDECILCLGPMGAPKFVKPVQWVAHNALIGGVDKESKLCVGCIVRLTCGHAFHIKCMKDWVTGSEQATDWVNWRQALPANICPVCRKIYPHDDVARTLGVRAPGEPPVGPPPRLGREELQWAAEESEEMRWAERRARERRIAELVAEDRRAAEERIAKAGPSHMVSSVLGTTAALFGGTAVGAALGEGTHGPDGAWNPSVLGTASHAAMMGVGAAGARLYEDWHGAWSQARERERMRAWLQNAPARADLRFRQEGRRAVGMREDPHLEALLRELGAE